MSPQKRTNLVQPTGDKFEVIHYRYIKCQLTSKGVLAMSYQWPQKFHENKKLNAVYIYNLYIRLNSPVKKKI